MKRLLALTLLLSACGAAPERIPVTVQIDPASFSGQKALFEVHGLVAQGSRDAGTPGAEKAARYLAARLRAVGVAAAVETFTNQTPRGPRAFHNVVGTLPGSTSNLILVASHFDTKAGIGPGFQGANDSGSSCGVLLELARAIAKRPRIGPEIRLLFFDGEECLVGYSEIDGFHGSREYAEKLVREGRKRDVRALILLDMVGDRDLTITLPRNVDQQLAIRFLRAAEEEGIRTKFALSSYEVGDDHVPFLERGMPAVDIIDFQYGSGPGLNDYWHTLQDTTDKLDAGSLQGIGRTTLRVINGLMAD